MNLSDRYSCQEHGKNVEQGCVACEVYNDIKELETEHKGMKKTLEWIVECSTGHNVTKHVVQNTLSKLK